MHDPRPLMRALAPLSVWQVDRSIEKKMVIEAKRRLLESYRNQKVRRAFI